MRRVISLFLPERPAVSAPPPEVSLRAIALWALRRYSPLVALDGADGLLVDASGVARLFGGEKTLLEDMLCSLAARGIAARAAMAATIGAAHALARFGASRTSIATGEDAVMPLPLAALRLDPPLVDRLTRLGFASIADLAALPRAPLARRFGAAPGLRLDQLLGRVAEPMQPLTPPELAAARRDFAEPITSAAALAHHTGALTTTLCARLQSEGLGARRLDLLFHRVDASAQAIRVGTAKPVCDAKPLTRLLLDRLDSADPGFGVEAMVLAAPLTEPLLFRQEDALGKSAGDVTGLVDTLTNRLGAGRVYRMLPVESDLPERSVRRIPPLTPPRGENWPAWPRPARLLAHAELVETIAVLPDQPPVAFTWRGVRRRVARADGPERVFGEWWRHDDETDAVRDYFVVEDESGARFWLFRSGDGEDKATGDRRWYLHGIFG